MFVCCCNRLDTLIHFIAWLTVFNTDYVGGYYSAPLALLLRLQQHLPLDNALIRIGPYGYTSDRLTVVGVLDHIFLCTFIFVPPSLQVRCKYLAFRRTLSWWTTPLTLPCLPQHNHICLNALRKTIYTRCHRGFKGRLYQVMLIMSLQHYWKRNVGILTKFSTLIAPKIVILKRKISWKWHFRCND